MTAPWVPPQIHSSSDSLKTPSKTSETRERKLPPDSCQTGTQPLSNPYTESSSFPEKVTKRFTRRNLKSSASSAFALSNLLSSRSPASGETYDLELSRDTSTLGSSMEFRTRPLMGLTKILTPDLCPLIQELSSLDTQETQTKPQELRGRSMAASLSSVTCSSKCLSLTTSSRRILSSSRTLPLRREATSLVPDW